MSIGEAIYEEREHPLFSNGEHTKTFRHSTLKMLPPPYLMIQRDMYTLFFIFNIKFCKEH